VIEDREACAREITLRRRDDGRAAVGQRDDALGAHLALHLQLLKGLGRAADAVRLPPERAFAGGLGSHGPLMTSEPLRGW